MTRILSLFVMFMLTGVMAFAQNRVVTGTVTDENGQPVENATITVVGTRTATKTDQNGSFRFNNLAPSANLRMTFTGVTPQDMPASTSFVSFKIVRTAASSLENVIVTGQLGLRRPAKELGGATARLTNAEVNKAAPVNIANGLQGKVSGLNITTVDNGVFENVKINLRGIRSLTGNNNPLLLLDGVPTNLNYLSSINPNDIADVNILKGAGSAALYGPDAVNGVIVVTTKRGTNGVPEIRFSHTTQLAKIAFLPEFQYQFGSGGYGEYIPYENWSWGDAFDGSMRPLGKPLPNGRQQMVQYSPLIGEREAFFNTGVTSQNDISYTGKDFLISLQDVKISGIVPDDENRRTSIRLNTSREYNKVRINFGVNYIQGNYNIFNDAAMSAYNAANNVGLNGGLLNLIFNTPAQIPIRRYKDFTNDEFSQYNNYFNDYGHNPYFAIDNWRQSGRSDDLIANVEFNYKANTWLNFTYRAAANVTNTGTTSTSKGENPNAFGLTRSFKLVPGNVTESFNRGSRLSSEIFGTAVKTFGDVRVTAILGNYIRQSDNRSTSVGASQLVVPEVFNVGNRTGEPTASSFLSRQRLLSFYTQLGFNYKFFNIEGNLRNDRYSVLDPSERSVYYPSVNTAIVLTDAFPSLKTDRITYAKIRASYGKTGNVNLGPYALQPIYGQASGFPFGSLPGFTAGNGITDPLITPEFVKSLEAGFELGLFKNRLNVQASYFHQNNTEQIIGIQVSPATGYTQLTTNAAAFVNRGVEMDFNLTPLIKVGDLNIEMRANATYNDSKVLSLFPGLDELFVGGFNNFAGNYAIAGYPAFVFKATDYQRDSLGRVIVGASDGFPILDPASKIYGRTMPLWTVGLTPSATWKGITISATAEYKTGHQVFNKIGDDMAWTGVSKASAVNNRERFVFPNSVIPQLDGSGNPTGKYVENRNVTVSNVNDFFTGVYRDVASNFLTSAASWRIREVSLGYRFPNALLANQKLIKALTFTVNARNLFLWTPKSNEYSDPDFNFSTGNTSGVGTSQINPPTRIIGATVAVTF